MKALTEGRSFKVIVKDSKGSQIELKGKIPASSAEENINSLFKPIVNGMSSFLFWDPFSAIGVYDPIVYADLKNVKAPGWSNPSVKRITLKKWVVKEGEFVKKGDLIATVSQDDESGKASLCEC